MTDTTAVWNRLANFWDARIKEGNTFQQKLIMPTTDAMLGDVERKRILDACCGNGHYARRLAGRGAEAVAFDGAQAFIDCAIARTPAGNVAYHVIDATDEPGLRALGENTFDAIVCSMALMDVPDLNPFFSACDALLKSHGVVIFSVCHPCFNSLRLKHTAALVDDGHGRLQQTFGVEVTHYKTPLAELSEGIINQPEPHPMFHRSISDLLRPAFAHGFVVDAMEEPAFEFNKSANPFSWEKRPEIPPALVVRLKRA